MEFGLFLQKIDIYYFLILLDHYSLLYGAMPDLWTPCEWEVVETYPQLPWMSPAKIWRLRTISARTLQVHEYLRWKIHIFRARNLSRTDLIEIITKPLPIVLQRLRSSNRSDGDAPTEGVLLGDPYIGMIIPEDVILSMMLLLLEYPEFRPTSIQGIDAGDLMSLFTNTITRTSQTWSPSNPEDIRLRHVVTFIDPGKMRKLWLTIKWTIHEKTIPFLNERFRWHTVQFAWLKTQMGWMTITGWPQISNTISWMTLFAPSVIIAPSWSPVLWDVWSNKFQIDFWEGRSHEAFLHTTLGFRWVWARLPGNTWDRVYVSGDVHDSLHYPVDKSTSWGMTPFDWGTRTILPHTRHERDRGTALTHDHLVARVIGFREFWEALRNAQIKDYADYKKWLETHDNKQLALRCFRQLHDAGYLTPNLAPDWSVWSSYMSETLGFTPNWLWKLRSNHFDWETLRVMLIKWAGNNQWSLRNISDQRISGWKIEGIGDNLYVDMVAILSRKIAECVPTLQWWTLIREYIAYNLIDTLRRKYRTTHSNQYGSIKVKPAEMTIENTELRTIEARIAQEFRKVHQWGKLTPIDSHGEFEGTWDESFLAWVAGEISKLGNLHIDGLFRDIMTPDRKLNVSELLMFWCYPFDFTWGDFRDIPRLYKDGSIDMSVDKRASSHQCDADYYTGLADMARKLKSGWVYITDGMRESYSRVLRLESEKMFILLDDPSISLWKIVDASRGTDTLRSLIIYKNTGDATVDELFLISVTDNIAGTSRIERIQKTTVTVRTNPWRDGHHTQRDGALEVFSRSCLNQCLMFVRDQIGVERFDNGVHSIIERHAKTWEKQSLGILIQEILVYLAVNGIQDPMSRERVEQYVRKSVDSTLKLVAMSPQSIPDGRWEEILDTIPSGLLSWWNGEKEHRKRPNRKRALQKRATKHLL